MVINNRRLQLIGILEHYNMLGLNNNGGFDVDEYIEVPMKDLVTVSQKLAGVINRKPWTYPALRNLLNEAKTGLPGKDFDRALNLLGATIDGVDLEIARATPTQVLANPHNIQPNTLVLGKSIWCANPACVLRVKFVPRSSRQTYHSIDCKYEAYNLRRRKPNRS